MSRIHEALQRAAGQEASAATPAESSSAEHAEEREIADLAREPFPVEIATARRMRVHLPEPAPVTDAVAAAESKPSDDDPARPRKTLFERLDTRLAEKVVVDANISPVSREQYRRLAAVLHDAQGNNGIKVIMVASAVAGEGKTLTATNMALTLSDSYRRRVLLIDADLRKPALDTVFRLNTTSGLIDGLEAHSDVKLVLRQVSSYLSVLPAGRPTADPMAGLSSDRMRRLIDEAKEAFDWVIIDTPPLMLLPDAHVLSSLVDGAVLVVKANSTPHEMVKRTVDLIGRERVMGVVLNRADSVSHHGYDGYGSYDSQYALAKPETVNHS